MPSKPKHWRRKPGWRSFLWAAGLLPGSSNLPEGYPFSRQAGKRLRSEPLLPSYLVLLRVGFSLPRRSPSERCALTLSPLIWGPHLFTLIPADLRQLGDGKPPPWDGIFSVALSVSATPLRHPPKEAQPILAVSQHTALRSPDFPPH